MALGHTDIAVSNKLLEKGLVTEDVHESAQGASSWDKAGRSVSQSATDSIKECSTSLQSRGARERELEGRHAPPTCLKARVYTLVESNI